jgi:hypothetical protein
MTGRSTDERIDAALEAFLDDVARDTTEAPTTAEMALRVSRGAASRRPGLRPELLLAAAILTAALVSVLVVGAQRRDDQRLDHAQLSLRTDPSPSAAAADWCDLGTVILTPAHLRAIGDANTGLGPHMTYGDASWVEAGTSSGGVVVFQGPGNVASAVLADISWPNGRPNVTRVMDMAPDGTTVVVAIAQSSPISGHGCGDLFVLDTTGREVRKVFEGGVGRVTSWAGLSPDGRYLAIVGVDGRGDHPTSFVEVVTPTGEPVIEPASEPCVDVRSAWARTGHRLAIACAGGHEDVTVLDIEGGRLVQPGPASRIAALGWSSDDRMVLVATVDGPGTAALSIHRIDLAGAPTRDVVAEFGGLDVNWMDPFSAWMFSPDGRHLTAVAGVPAAQVFEYTYLIDTANGQVRQTDAALLVPGQRDVGWTMDGSALVSREISDVWDGSAVWSRAVIGDASGSRLIAMAPDGSASTDIGIAPRDAWWTTEAPPS